VPKPEVDVSVLPPPPRQQQPREAKARSETRVPMLALIGVLLLLGAVETAKEMANADPGESVGYNLGLAFGGAVPEMLGVAVVALVVGVVVYLTYFRSGGVTFLQALFNWQVVAAAVVVALLQIVA
jgi:hypothetical protein